MSEKIIIIIKHNLKVENYVLFSMHTEDLTPGDSLSDSSGDCSKEVREKPGYIGVLATKIKYSDIIRLLLIKEKQDISS